MTTKPYRKGARQRKCHTHPQYLASNCPLCALALKAFLDKELNVPAPSAEGRYPRTRPFSASDGIPDGRRTQRQLN